MRLSIDEQVEQGKQRAAERFAQLTPEQQTHVLGASDRLLDELQRSLVGVENPAIKKGYMPVVTLSPTQMDRWKALDPQRQDALVEQVIKERRGS